MKKLGISCLLVMFMLFAGLTVAQAGERYSYIGLSLGKAKDIEFDEKSDAYKFYGGFAYNRYVALEVAYVDLGNYNYDIVEEDGFYIDLIGIYPVAKRLDVFGKLGFFKWDYDVAGEPVAKGEDLAMGLGARVKLGSSIGLRAEWERFTQILDGNVDLYTVGIELNFRD